MLAAVRRHTRKTPHGTEAREASPSPERSTKKGRIEINHNDAPIDLGDLDEDSNHCILLSRRGHLAELRFFSSSMPATNLLFTPDIFNKTPAWLNIAQFSVITGVNGSGKSTLLKYINRHLLRNKVFPGLKPPDVTERDFLLEEEVLYIGVNHSFTDISSSGGEDTSYVVGHKFDECLGQLINYYNDGKAIGLDFAMQVQKEIEEDPEKPAEKSKEYIIRAMHRTINYKLKDFRLTDPVSFLGYICQQYNKRVELITKQAQDISYVFRVFRYYTELDETEINELHKSLSVKTKFTDIESLLKEVGENPTFNKALIYRFGLKQSGINPLHRMNQILEKYNFPYRLYYEPDWSGKEAKLVFIKGETKIEPISLSSGEIMILRVMAWMFATNGLRASSSDPMLMENSVKIILLDEPDRHLDPKLSKKFFQIIHQEIVKANNIQVIMTTHRIDSLALIPESEEARIYTIEKDAAGISFIMPTTKLRAMFRITHNIREMNNLHTKVYVEAHDDARFYEGVYKWLMQYSNQLREAEGSKDKDKLLSRRYQFSFYSAAYEKGSGGGCSEVEQLVRRDLASRETHEATETSLAAGTGAGAVRTAAAPDVPPLASAGGLTSWLHLATIAICKPFGIIDGDFEVYKFTSTEVGSRIKQLKRHSLENYLYDPFVLISICKPEFIPEPLKLICFRILEAIKDKNKESIQAIVDEYFKTLIQLIFNNYKGIKESYNPSQLDGVNWSFAGKKGAEAKNIASILVENINLAATEKGLSYDREKHFEELKKEILDSTDKLSDRDKKQFDLLCNMVKADRILPYFSINGELTIKKIHYSAESEEIGVRSEGGEIFSIIYPKIFFKLKGHDIREVFPGASRDILLTNLTKVERLCIPGDLAEVFYELNKKMRAQANVVVKPGLLIPEPEDELMPNAGAGRSPT